MIVNCVWEHNGNDTLLYAVDHIGAYTRGENLDIALSKMPGEISSYLKWLGEESPQTMSVAVIGEKESTLNIQDADSDVLFESEKMGLTQEEYQRLKKLALKSAEDFMILYRSIPDNSLTCVPVRNTFYGQVPRTATEMYAHTKNVNAYYFAEINIEADNDDDIYECRRRGFDILEQTVAYLQNSVYVGSYGEEWSVKKVLRRFIWHDRIHAKAMYRMAVKVFGRECIANPYFFDI